jgi:PAS domain S-box-containing protein
VPALGESAFKAIVEQSLIGSLLVENQKVVYANQCFAQIFGRLIKELIGLQLDQVIYPNEWGQPSTA